MIRLLLGVGLLTLVYTLELGSFDPWDVLVGVLAAGGLIALFRERVRPPGAVPRPIRLGQLLAFWPFLGAVLWDVLVGAWDVAKIVLGLAPAPRSGIVAIPIEERTELGVTVSSWAISLSPGTAVLDVDRDRGVILLHVLDASDPEELREKLRRFYVRYQRPVFP